MKTAQKVSPKTVQKRGALQAYFKISFDLDQRREAVRPLALLSVSLLRCSSVHLVTLKYCK